MFIELTLFVSNKRIRINPSFISTLEDVEVEEFGKTLGVATLISFGNFGYQVMETPEQIEAMIETEEKKSFNKQIKLLKNLTREDWQQGDDEL